MIEDLVVCRKEVYAMSQLWDLYCKTGDHTNVRAIDIKNLLQERLLEKVQFCKPSGSSDKVREYILPSDMSVLPDSIHAINTGKSITNHIQLRSISRSISDIIKCDVPNQTCSPTSKNLIEVDDPLNRRLFNLVLRIVSPNSYAGKDGFVKLSDRKAVKVKEICQNIQSLVPSVQPSRSQILLSMTMYGKTGSKNVINDVHHWV